MRNSRRDSVKPEMAQTGKHRNLNRWWRGVVLLLTLVGIGLTLNQLFFILPRFGISLYEVSYFYGLYAALLSPVFLIFPARKTCRRDIVPWYDIVLFMLSLACFTYFSINGFKVFFEAWMFYAPMLPTIVGLILLFLVLESIRRTIGGVFFFLVLFFFFFPMFTQHLFPPFTGIGFSFLKTIKLHSMGTESLIGLPIKVLGNLLLGFMVFGVAMTATGGGTFFLNLSMSMLGHRRGGPAKVAVLSSALFGSLSGSIISNVLTTGSITIPTMKKTGYPSYYAAAIETCASTGGVLMPPVMGATAFIMAMILNIPYIQVAVAAAIPSILYFIGLLMQVDAYAAKTGIAGLSKADIPPILETFKRGWFYIFALVLLIWFIGILRLEGQAPFYTTAALLVLTMLRKETRLNISGFMNFIENVARLLADLMPIFAGVSIMIGSLMMTGVSSSFASEIVSVAGGNIYLLLLLGAATSLLLGTGMTITVCYIFLALTLAPALVDSGLNSLAVHLFILYYAMLSFITPPVAIGAFAAATIAQAPPMRTGFQAMRLGLITYFIPFFFVLSPALILQGPLTEIIHVVITCLLGVVLISGALEGYLWGMGRIGWISRCIIFSSGFLLVIPEVSTNAYGILLAFTTVISSVIWRKFVKNRKLITDVNN